MLHLLQQLWGFSQAWQTHRDSEESLLSCACPCSRGSVSHLYLQGSPQQAVHRSTSDLQAWNVFISTCLQEQLSTMLSGPGVSRNAVSCLNQPQPRASFVRAPLNPVGSNTAISAAGPGGRTKQQGGQREGKHHSAQQVAFMWSSIRPCIERLTCHGTHALHMGPQRHRA